MGRGQTFSYRAGIRIRETVLACDPASGRGLGFISHARCPIPAGSRQVLSTEITLALAGRAGQRVRPTALLAAYGRPFSLGEVRVELFPTGYLPGAASLLCDRGGSRAIYTGVVGADQAPAGVAPREARTAAALCMGGTFGSARFRFPPRDEARAAVRRFAEEALAAGQAPVLLASAMGTALDAGAVLAAAGIGLRGHREIVAAAAAFRGAGLEPPRIARFAGKIGANEALLWPPGARAAAQLGGLAAPVFALVSGLAQDPTVLGRARVDVGIALCEQADFAGLLAYADATGAAEIAVLGGFAEELGAALRARGHDAYAVGPPQQLDFPDAPPATGFTARARSG